MLTLDQVVTWIVSVMTFGPRSMGLLPECLRYTVFCNLYLYKLRINEFFQS